MILNSRASEALRRAALTGETPLVPLEQFQEHTLAGMLETIATAVGTAVGSELIDYFNRQAKESASLIGSCWRTWSRTEHPYGGDIHGIRSVEFYRLRTQNDQINPSYQLFRERFVRSLQACGFAKIFAYALAGALAEMTDNVIQHSRSGPGEFTGLAGYHVATRYMAFAVIDIGQGVLASLTQSPAWQHLASPAEALRAAVCANASSRVDQPSGDGFRTLFRSLTDRNGRLRFRSDNAALTLGDGGTHRQGVEMSSPPLRGLQISVCCALDGCANERAIESS